MKKHRRKRQKAQNVSRNAACEVNYTKKLFDKGTIYKATHTIDYAESNL